MVNKKFDVSPTLKNYLKNYENGTPDSLLLEVCEKLYQLQIDYDELVENYIPNLEKKFLDKLERKE